MPPADGTRSQAHAQAQEHALYDRLLKRATTVQLSNEVAATLVSVAKTTLQLYPLEPGGSEHPLREEVRTLMTSLLPAPSQIFTESFLRSPLFPVLLLRDVASLYGCGAADMSFTSSLHLPPHELTDRNIQLFTWFAYFAGCDSASTRDIVDCYKRTRSSTSIPASRGSDRRSMDIRETSGARPLTGAIPQQQASMNRLNQSQDQAQGNSTGEQHPTTHPTNNPTNHPTNPPTNRPRGQLNQTPSNLVDYDDTRKASYVHQHCKDRKFTGDITQSMELFLRDYNVCTRQHKLSPTQQADYFVNILEGPARTFFFNHARSDMNFQEMAAMMIREYNSDARQLQVQGTLELLRLDKFMSKHGITDVSEGLLRLSTSLKS